MTWAKKASTLQLPSSGGSAVTEDMQLTKSIRGTKIAGSSSTGGAEGCATRESKRGGRGGTLDQNGKDESEPTRLNVHERITTKT